MNNQFLIICLFFSFCSNPTTHKQPPIPANDMKKILQERQWQVASINSYHHTEKLQIENVDSILSSIHTMRGYTDEEFQQSWDYYLHQNNNELITIYDEILQDLELARDTIKN